MSPFELWWPILVFFFYDWRLFGRQLCLVDSYFIPDLSWRTLSLRFVTCAADGAFGKGGMNIYVWCAFRRLSGLGRL